MPIMNMIEAVNSALRTEIAEDERIVVFGEDVAHFGGVFRATKGLQETFGPERIMDTPLSENGIIGAAIGMALYGLRPVAEIQFADFIYPGFDQIVNELAKYRYRTGGQFEVPVVLRTPFGGGIRGGHYHSQSPEAYFLHTPGLKVVCPSSPYDAKGLLCSAIRDDDPVIFFEPKRIYRSAKGEVPEERYEIPLGQAAILRPGSQITVVAWGAMLHEALKAAEQAATQGIDCEVIDLKTLLPLDLKTIIASVKKTGRFVVVHEAPQNCGFGAELIAQVTEHAFYSLVAQPRRVTGYDTPFPYTREMDYLPLAPRILHTLNQTIHESA